jgi:hypothetical protein
MVPRPEHRRERDMWLAQIQAQAEALRAAAEALVEQIKAQREETERESHA